MLLLGQQGCHGGEGLVGGKDTPGGDRQPPCGQRVGGSKAKAFRGELAGQGDGVLPGGAGGVVHGDPGCADGGHGQGQQAGDHAAAPPDAAARGTVSGGKECLTGGG